MNQIDVKISNFVKKAFDIPHRLFAFPYKNKIGENGVKYSNQFLRSTSMLLDLTLIIVILQFFSYLFGKFFVFPLEIVSKYQMHIDITADEKKMLFDYYSAIFIFQFAQVIMIAAYVSFMWHRFGGTVGKLLFGLRVLDEKTLQKPSISQCMKRFFMFPLSVLCLFIGVIWSVFDKKSRTWHDIVSGTVVVVKKSLP